MNNFQKNVLRQVPPWELCKLIPQGEFEDSVFVWVVNGDYQPKFQIVDLRKYPFIPENGATLYPAPTLQEIMEAVSGIKEIFEPDPLNEKRMI